LSVASLEYGAVAPYRVFKAGKHSLSSGAQQREVMLSAGGFYTTALIAGRWWVNQDQSAATLTQARIGLYNLSGATISLKTADGQLTLHNDLPALEYAMRPVNPVKVKLSVFAGGKAYPLPEVQLEASSAYSVIVVGEAGKLRVAWQQNTTESR
jgi:alginate O-acetyltransferase complex protein AlgF